MEKYKKTLKIVGNVVGWVFVAFALVVTIVAFSAQSNGGIPSVGGKNFLTVASDSMEPTFFTGDLIVGETLTQKQAQELEVGTVITFRRDLNNDGVEELNSHKIIGINYDANGDVYSYLTKGDNPRAPVDEPVRWQMVVAKWNGTRIGGVGAVIDFLQSSTGFLVCIVAPLFLFFLYELYKFITVVISIRNRGKVQLTAADKELMLEKARQDAIEEYKKQLAREAQQAAGQAAPAQNAETETENNQNP